MTLEEFNVLDRDSARNTLRPCVDIDRWLDAVVDARPYVNLEDVLRVARESALPWTEAELDGALAHHPRIGETASGASAEASFSRSEQAGVDPKDTAVTDALVDGNRAYEGKFGRVFLIRAAGRSAADMLTSLRNRMMNSPEEEVSAAAQQLRQIALLRLEGILVP